MRATGIGGGSRSGWKQSRFGPRRGTSSITESAAFRQILCCPQCRSGLLEEPDVLTCDASGSRYSLIDGVPRFVPAAFAPTSPARYAWLAAFKDQLKSLPGLYATLAYISSPL